LFLLELSRFIKIGQASEILGVTPQTLRRWEREGQFSADRGLFGLSTTQQVHG